MVDKAEQEERQLAVALAEEFVELHLAVEVEYDLAEDNSIGEDIAHIDDGLASSDAAAEREDGLGECDELRS